MNRIKTPIWTAVGTLALAALVLAPAASADQVILDDLIVDGSICAGLDCVNGESFGFDTLRLKENNLRIKAQDTSTSASFPTNDWQITFNESSNGGQNKFSIDDIDGGRTPFTIEAGAPSHSLYVDDGGRIGLGTSTPVVEVHIKDGDTPTLRLEQDGSSGFTPQTWDVAGNETNFFVRDATNGSTLPFRIRPTAPSNSIYVDTSDGDVGMGTSSPEATLHVFDNSGSGVDTMLLLENNGGINLSLEDNSTGTLWRTRNRNTEFDIVDPNNLVGGNVHVRVQQNGNMTVAGSLTELMASARAIKKDFAPVDPQEVLRKVADLPITEWSYKYDDSSIRHLGPMAEDFMDSFGLGVNNQTIAPRDEAAVALVAIQGLNEIVSQKNAEISELESRLAELESLVRSLTSE